MSYFNWLLESATTNVNSWLSTAYIGISTCIIIFFPLRILKRQRLPSSPSTPNIVLTEGTLAAFTRIDNNLNRIATAVESLTLERLVSSIEHDTVLRSRDTHSIDVAVPASLVHTHTSHSPSRHNRPNYHHRSRADSIDQDLFENDRHLEIGDLAIILHRYRGQYGKIGVVTSAIEQYVWLQTGSNKIIQKRRDKVSYYRGPTPPSLQRLLDSLPYHEDHSITNSPAPSPTSS